MQHALLALRHGGEVMAPPRLGSSWEGFACEHVIQALGAEVDLVVPRGGKLCGIERSYDDCS